MSRVGIRRAARAGADRHRRPRAAGARTGPARPPPASPAARRCPAPPGAAKRRRTCSPDSIKSWDVLRSLSAIDANGGPDTPVLDMGSVGCAILPALHRLGYRRLPGIDLNPQVRQHAPRRRDRLPRRRHDRRRVARWQLRGDHGDQRDRARRRRRGAPARGLAPAAPGRRSSASRPTTGRRRSTPRRSGCSSCDWRIFSAEEIEALVETARDSRPRAGRRPEQAIRTAGERPMQFAGRDYTFLFGALVRG